MSVIPTYIGGHAKRGTLTGWYCANCLKYWGKHSDMAERCCATDRACDDCGQPTGSRDYSICRGCRSLRERKRWEEFALVPWNGEPVMDYQSDWYGFDEQDVYEYVAEHPACCLVLAKPYKPREFELENHLADVMAEDEELDIPPLVAEALETVNEWIRTTVFSYTQSKQRVIIEVPK